MTVSSKHYRIILVGIVSLTWLWSVIQPLSYKDWLLENVLFFALIPVIFIVGKKYEFTNFSYTLVALYICIHLIGSHYTYGKVPFGETLADWFGTERNMYDRLIHFSYGLLIYQPIRQIYLKLAKPNGFFSYFFPFLITLAITALYEMGEWIIAAFTSFRVASEFIAAQGDFFDAQKDTFMVCVGAVIAWAVVLATNSRRNKNAIM